MEDQKKDLFEDEYDLMENPGEGADAIVYKAKHKKLGYVRAIKVLNRFIKNEDDPKYKKFIEECKTLLRLGNGGHKNIVGITRPRLLDNRAVVEMDFVQGKDLDEFLESSQRFLPYTEVLNLMVDISDALSYCHYSIYSYCIDPNEDTCVTDPSNISADCERLLVQKYKVIHNDIHSRNIRRRTDGRYVLLDFGLAIEQGTQIKSSIRKAGAVEYKAPEKWDENEITFTEQGDVYSFGILMYEALAGNVPFPFDRKKPEQIAVYEVMNHHKHTRPDAIEPRRRAAFERTNTGAWKKDYPDWMERIIMKCLEKDPSARFKNGKELFQEIQKHVNVQSQSNLNSAQQARQTDELRAESESLRHVVNGLSEEKARLKKELDASEARNRRKIEELERSNAKLSEDTAKAQRAALQAEQRQKRVSSGTIATFVYLAIALCTVSAFATYFIMDRKNRSTTKSIAAAETIQIFGAKDYGVRFYSNASFDFPKDAKITTREIVPVLKDSNGFAFIIFTNSNNVETQGWINKMEASEEGARKGREADSLAREARAAAARNELIAAIDLYKQAQGVRPRKEITARIDQLNKRAQALADKFELLITETKIEQELDDCHPLIVALYDSVLKVAARPRIQQLKDACANNDSTSR